MNPSVYFNMALQMFQRANPIAEVGERVMAILETLLNYNSNLKLNKYRYNLYMQQLNRMEGFLSEGSPYQNQGAKMDRKF